MVLNRSLLLKKDTSMTDLSLVPTNDLTEELVKRHDAVVLTGIKYTKEDEYITFRLFSGNRFVCNGLIGVINTMIANDEIGHTMKMNRNNDR